MDKRLKSAMDGIDLLAMAVREGVFLENVPPGKGRKWRYNGIVFASEASDPESTSPFRQSPAFTITAPYASEAGALLNRLLDLFRPLLNECIEHGFIDRLGEVALEYSTHADPSDQTAVNLLKILMAEAGDILEEMREGEFPYATDKEGWHGESQVLSQ